MGLHRAVPAKLLVQLQVSYCGPIPLPGTLSICSARPESEALQEQMKLDVPFWTLQMMPSGIE